MRAQPGIFAFQNRFDHLAGKFPFQRRLQPEGVVDEIGKTVVLGVDRCFISGMGDRDGAVAFVESEPRPVLFDQILLGAQAGVIREALEKKPLAFECQRFLAHPLIEGPADAAADLFRFGGDPIEVTETDGGSCIRVAKPRTR